MGTLALNGTYMRVAILALVIVLTVMSTVMLRQLRKLERERAELLAELRSQHVKDSFVNEAIGLHNVIDIAHRRGRPLDTELRGQVHDAINEAFEHYRAAAAFEIRHAHAHDIGSDGDDSGHSTRVARAARRFERLFGRVAT
jgi:ABC-type uncharacterized transport system fused permease/ATPase subunit